MKVKDRNYIFYLEDMRESMELVISYVADMTYETLTGDRKTIDAVIRNFGIIGEASKHLPGNLVNLIEIIEKEKAIPDR